MTDVGLDNLLPTGPALGGFGTLDSNIYVIYALKCTMTLMDKQSEYMCRRDGSDLEHSNLFVFIFFADPFAEDSIDTKKADTKDYVHIRVQQRNGKKSLTTVQGLPKAFDLKKILKALKKGGYSLF